MTLLRFLICLFALIGTLACCAAAMAVFILALRFWPVLLVITLSMVLFSWLLKQLGIRITHLR